MLNVKTEKISKSTKEKVKASLQNGAFLCQKESEEHGGVFAHTLLGKAIIETKWVQNPNSFLV